MHKKFKPTAAIMKTNFTAYRWKDVHLLDWELPGRPRRCIKEEWWTRTAHRSGPLHGEYGPAHTVTRTWDGSSTETWYRNGVIHRGVDEPAHTSKQFLSTGPRFTETHYKDGKKHRDSGAAVQVFDHHSEGSIVVREEWWSEGVLTESHSYNQSQ